MSRNNFIDRIISETKNLRSLGVSKSQELFIEKFTKDSKKSPQAVISGKKYSIFNSNDYLGLRFHPRLIEAEHKASQRFGVGPGAVRFISGSLLIHRQLEESLAKYHHRESAIVFSSAFSANFSTIPALVDKQTLIISDELNHRSIIDGIRVSGLPSENRQVYRHLDLDHLSEILSQNIGKSEKCLVISDGVFSMLGEIADLQKLRKICDLFDAQYPQGVLLYIDDAHGIGVLGDSGRGTEEYSGKKADILAGTLGKAFGCDGGYVVGDSSLITYLREKAAGYIYSNNLSPGTASAALAAIDLVDSSEGKQIVSSLHRRMQPLKSKHAIIPLVLADSQKTINLKNHLFDNGILVTAINYPVVPKGRDEIRLQLSASHTDLEIKTLLTLIHAAYPDLYNSVFK